MTPFAQDVTEVQDPVALEAARHRLAKVPELAVDVEADSMHAFRARLCFVQLGTEDEIVLLDTLAPGVSASAVAPLLGDPERTKFFHAAQGDLQYLAEAGVRVRALFDTHRAATLLGWPKVGLADLVRERLGVTLAKEHQQADFAQRPLPLELGRYIADDVRYLTEIGRQVRDACRAADILEEVLLDCERMCAEAAARPAVAPYAPKVSGALPPAERSFQAAVAARLHALRLAWAEASDVPMGKMLSNAAIQAILGKPPRTLRELARTMGVRGEVVRQHGEEVLALLVMLRGQSERGELPLPGALPRDPRRKKREDALKAFRAEKALERRVTASVVLPNPLVERLAADPPSSMEELAAVPYFGSKRLVLYGEALLALLREPGTGAASPPAS